MNSVNIIGNIGHDLELRDLGNDSKVLNFNVGVRGYGEKTDWFRVTVWNKQAENVAKYCGKGSKVGVTGSLTTNEFQDKNGNTVKNVEIRAFNVEFLDSKKSKQTQGGQQQASDPFANTGTEVEIDDSDLPF